MYFLLCFVNVLASMQQKKPDTLSRPDTLKRIRLGAFFKRRAYSATETRAGYAQNRPDTLRNDRIRSAVGRLRSYRAYTAPGPDTLTYFFVGPIFFCVQFVFLLSVRDVCRYSFSFRNQLHVLGDNCAIL